MRKLLVALAVLSFAACAEFDTDASSSETVTMGQSVVVEADDGQVFEVSIVHDGSLTTVEETAILEAIEVIGVTTTENDEITPVATGRHAYVPPIDTNLIPGQFPVSIYVTGVDSETLVDEYRWDWIDDIDEDQLEAFVEDLCPPWH